MATKAEIMAALKAQKEKSSGAGKRTTSSTGDNASYPFWNIEVGDSATIRFLPDGDTNNTFFWVERQVIKMPFSGIVGGDYPTNREATVTVPCVDMWGEQCPIIAETRPWWKQGPEMEAQAKKYWKKKSYIFQGFVVSSPFQEENLPENPIRRFVINKSIFEIIEKALMDPEMEDMPTDYVGGVDFRIRKTKQGQYSNYTTSEWSRKTRSLNEAELIAVEQHGLFNLKDYMGRRPDADEMAAIKAMFRDSVDGQPFDVDSYGKYFRAYTGRGDDDASSQIPTSAVSARASAPVAESRSSAPAAVAEEVEDRPAPAVTETAKPSAHEILERIKNRTLNK